MTNRQVLSSDASVRIPDIFGTVRASPDIIAVPYSLYRDHLKYEYSYYCIGRGAFQVEQVREGIYDIKDGTTVASDIPNMLVEVYPPGTSPNSPGGSDNAQLRIDSATRYVSVATLNFILPNLIQTTDITADFRTLFEAAQPLVISDCLGYEGTYTIISVGATLLSLNYVEGLPLWSDPATGKSGTLSSQKARPKINTPLSIVDDCAAVNDLVCLALNDARVTGNNDIYFGSGNVIATANPSVNFTTIFEQGTPLRVQNASVYINQGYWYWPSYTYFSAPCTLDMTYCWVANDPYPAYHFSCALFIPSSSFPQNILQKIISCPFDFSMPAPPGVFCEITFDNPSFSWLNGTWVFSYQNWYNTPPIPDSYVLTPPQYQALGQGDNNARMKWLAGQIFARYPNKNPAHGIPIPDGTNPVDNFSSNVSFQMHSDPDKHWVNTSFTYYYDGTYVLQNVQPQSLTLATNVDNEPDKLPWPYNSGGTSAILSSELKRWQGWFTLDVPWATRLIANFVARSGLYATGRVNNTTIQYQINTVMQLEIQPINADGTNRGPLQTVNITVEGSATTKAQRAATLDVNIASPGRVRIRACRTDGVNPAWDVTVTDTITWESAYVFSPIKTSIADFGNVTTVQVVRRPTDVRRVNEVLNLLVTRKLPARVSGNTFTQALFPTRSAADALFWAACDPWIGRLGVFSPEVNTQTYTGPDLDVDNIYDTIDDVVTYFGGTAPDSPTAPGEFCYTFSEDGQSLEETLQTIARAVHCATYRRDGAIRLLFERPFNPEILFNHRNILPGSESRTLRFGNENDYDGVALTWVDPTDESTATYHIPADMSAVNPKAIQTIGVRHRLAAHFHAWRAWARIQHQRSTVSMQTTHEAALLGRLHPILIADGTRPETQDGEILAQDGATLTLSQPCALGDGVSYVIHLQHSDGTVETLGATAGADAYHIVTAAVPRLPLVTDPAYYARTVYLIEPEPPVRTSLYLVDEITPQEDLTYRVVAILNAQEVYAHDADYLDRVVDAGGYDL